MNKRFKILIIIDWFPPAYRAGGPIRSTVNLIDSLSEFFDFYILTSNRDLGNIKLNVNHSRWLDYDTSVKVFYVDMDKSPFATIKEQIHSLKFDLAIVNGMYSWFYSILPVLLIKKRPLIIFPRGMLSEHSLASKTFKKKLFLNIIKILPLYKKLHYAVTGEEEYNDLKKIFPSADIFMVPNLVKKPEEFVPTDKKPGELRLINLSRISPVKNIELALEALKDNYNGKITYDIYGHSDNNEYLNKLKKISAKLPENIEVNFKGGYSGNTTELIRKYHFLFSTTKGENFGHSVYEAFSAGRPVIISDNTPWKNLELYNIGWDLPLEKKNFTEKIKLCLSMDNAQYRKMSLAAWQFAQQYYDRNKRNIQTLYFKLINIIKNG